MPLSESQKLFFLQRVFDEKEILFTQFKGVGDKSISANKKRETWQKIADELENQGASGKDIDWTYLRHTTWGNLKKNTLRKSTQLSQTGAAGKPYTEIERKVLDIVGRESGSVKPIEMGGKRKREEMEIAKKKENLSEILNGTPIIISPPIDYDHEEVITEAPKELIFLRLQMLK